MAPCGSPVHLATINLALGLPTLGSKSCNSGRNSNWDGANNSIYNVGVKAHDAANQEFTETEASIVSFLAS
jgi:hypothetical protein